MRPLDPRLGQLKLIAITDTPGGGWTAPERTACAALAGGLPALMLREREMTEEELLPIARRLKAAADAHGALLIVNRRLELARAIGAGAVHLGASGPSLAEARALLGEEVLLGYSAHRRVEALEALERGADYVTFSPIFATPSKAGILEPVGVEALAGLARQAPGRVVALGGIDEKNIAQVMRAGAAGAAVIRAIFAAADPAAAVRQLLDRQS